jgi:hypothetical protein
MQMIRSVLFITMLMFTGKLVGQEQIDNYQAFHLEHKEVAWLQVFHVDDTVTNLSKQLYEHLSHKSWVTALKFDGEDLIGELIEYKPDYKRYGGKYMNTSEVTRTGRWKSKVRISFKPGKYRVMLYGLNYIAKQSTTGSGKATIEQHPVNGNIEEWTLNNFRTAFRKNRMKDLDILHFSFKDSFTLKFNQLIDKDW